MPKVKIQPLAAPPAEYPLFYLRLGHVALAAFAFLLPTLAWGPWPPPLGPFTLGLLHVVGVGFVLSTVLGVFLQVVPVTLRSSPPRSSLLPLLAGLHLVGSGLLALGFFTWHPLLIAAGGSAVLLGLVLLPVALGPSLGTRRQAGGLHLYLVTGAFLLALALLAAVGLGSSLAGAALPVRFLDLLRAHIVLGFGAGFSLLILGMSQQLLPMFAIGPETRPWEAAAIYVLFLMAGAIALLAPGLPRPVEILGALALAISLVLWLLSAVRTVVRGRPAGRTPVTFFLLLPAAYAVGSIAWTIWGSLTGSALPLGSLEAIGLAFLLGWLGQSILAYEHRILPFIVWNHLVRRYARDLAVPKVDRYLDERLGALALLGFNLGLLGLLAALLRPALAPGVRLAGALLTAAGLLAALANLQQPFRQAQVFRPSGRTPKVPPSARRRRR